MSKRQIKVSDMNAETLKDLDPTKKKPRVRRLFCRIEEPLYEEAVKLSKKQKTSLNLLVKKAVFKYLKENA
jgi:predicted HicB family RNase H-like nuclease